jgi:hypothetical protein
MTEYGQGFVTDEQQLSNNVVAMDLGNNGGYGPVEQINALPATSPSYPVTGIAGLFSALIAWQQTPGSTGPSEIRVRYQPRASTLAPEQVASSPSQGPTDAGRGLAAAGDVSGDAAIAWVQGTGDSTQIVAERLYQAPGAASAPRSLRYSRSAQPVLAWAASGARWGPITYAVSLDGAQVGQTGGTALQVPAPLADGLHTWSVTATNPAGLSSTSGVGRVFVDTVAPRVRVRVTGARRVGASLTLRLSDRDAPPAGQSARAASGVATVTIRWGDGTVTHLKRGTRRVVHRYRRAGRYKITVIVADHAGNRTRLVRHVKIGKGAPVRKPAKKH